MAKRHKFVQVALCSQQTEQCKGFNEHWWAAMEQQLRPSKCSPLNNKLLSPLNAWRGQPKFCSAHGLKCLPLRGYPLVPSCMDDIINPERAPRCTERSLTQHSNISFISFTNTRVLRPPQVNVYCCPIMFHYTRHHFNVATLKPSYCSVSSAVRVRAEICIVFYIFYIQAEALLHSSWLSCRIWICGFVVIRWPLRLIGQCKLSDLI